MWDYIVVGAGTAGSVVANRLSADPGNRVLLLEAGGEDKGPLFRIPMLGPLKALGNPTYDWMDTTEPDPSRGGRTDLWSRGKVLGGSSAINGTVYVRGNRGDYDHWAQMGCSGWDYDSLEKVFRRIEQAEAGLSDVYGDAGNIHISRVRGPHALAGVFLDAMAECGGQTNPDYNGENQTGASFTHLTQRRGVRWSAARGYLDSIRSRKNLEIRTGAVVRRVIFKDKRAIGVEIEDGGKAHVEHVRGEVILSASAFNSPKLLMLSGIGDPEHLDALGIPVIHANPWVGKNLQEHPGVAVKAYVNVPTLNVQTGPLDTLWQGLRYLLTRSGPATHAFPAIGFVKLRPESADPDIEIHFAPYAYDLTPQGLKMFDRPAITLLANVNRSRSRGSVSLRSPDPRDPPAIQPNLLGDRWDLEMLVEGAKFARQLLMTPALSQYVTGLHAPGQDVQTTHQWEDYVRAHSVGSYHPCGTVKMGTDAQSVVDPMLRVMGVENLRVVDSSIIPQIPSGNINAISFVIGELGSDFILNYNSG